VTALTVFVPAGATVDMDSAVDVRAVERTARFRGFSHAVARFAPDVIFVPTARTADFGRVPVVTMVRNMEPLTVPFGGNHWAEGVKNLGRAWAARRACTKARRVIAVSNYVRDFVVSQWGLDPQRVATVYHGVDIPASALPAAGREGPALFTAGSIRPARGLEDVLRALPHLDPAVNLVIAGRVDPGCEGYASRLRALADRLRITRRVTFAGQLDEAAITSELGRSRIFVMTSRAEACPNTALEAMSCGIPSVAVDRPPMPEFFADAALYYPTGDAPALARRIRALLETPADMTRLSNAALLRARAFTWEMTRDRTIEELERAVS
jgi:glycosyltransferase involved in cell wall biosynthesis